jgi:crotonobetainyl-CoA:carnitine CoA-transferase CaiB-like acyl-CoA transferase
LKEKGDLEIVKKLISDADILINNFRPGVMDKIGLGFNDCKKINSNLIYASINGFGDAGPYSNAPAYDHVVQAMAGATNIQADNDEPAYIKTLLCDKITAYTVCQSLSSALYKRERTGDADRLNLSMIDSAVFFLWPDGMMNHTLLDDDVVTLPPLTKSYNLYKCKDGFLSIAALSDAQWFGIFRALGLPEYIEDERFNNAFARSENMVELFKSLTIFESLTVDDALKKLQDEDVPCSKTISLDELMIHPQVEANNLFQSIESNIQGEVRALRYPTIFDGNEMFNDSPAPALGEHKQEIIESLSN